MKIKKYSAAVFAVCVLSLGAASATPTRVIAFGDSFSDTGNLLIDTITQATGPLDPIVPPPTRYFEGRFSNGPVWVEGLAASLGTGSTVLPSQAFSPSELGAFILGSGQSVTFAYGGAGSGLSNTTPDGFFTVPGALGQVVRFQTVLDTVSAPTDALYTYWTGANDYAFGLAPDATPAEVEALIGSVIQDIGTGITELYLAGARKFLVPNLVDLGVPPLVELLYGPAAGEVAAGLREVTLAHNAALELLLQDLAGLPGARIIPLDVFSLGEAAFASLDLSPGPASGCLFAPLGVGSIETCLVPVDSFDNPPGAFWDELHPTAALHATIAGAAVRAVPVPAVVWLMLSALVAWWPLRRRRSRLLRARHSPTMG